jgi:putative spermidine/putrescine transport system permease protein
MILSRRGRILWAVVAATGLAFIYVPLIVVVINSFNPAKVFSWPPRGFSTIWWDKALHNDGVGATAIALVLGSMVAFAVVRYSWFGRDPVSFLVVLPIALPGIVTGIALNAAFSTVLGPLGISFGLFTVILGHATFCIVVVFNNVAARLRRTGRNLEEASMDLGADAFTTFRRVTFPSIRSALIAGALLAFALSFDEIVVTTFTSGPGIQTLPQWVFNNLFRPNQSPIVNAVAALLIILFVAPVYLAQRFSEAETGGRI